MGKKRKQDQWRDASSSSDVKRHRSCHCENGSVVSPRPFARKAMRPTLISIDSFTLRETSRPNDRMSPREGLSDIVRAVIELKDVMQLQRRMEEKFNKQIRKLKEKRKKDKKKHEVELRLLKEGLESKIQEMQKEECAEVNHYKASPSQRSQLSQSTRFRLVIENGVNRTIYKKETVKTEDGGGIKVVMYDGGNPIASDHHLASVRVELVVVDGRFDEKRDSWPKMEFDGSIIKPRERTTLTSLVNNGTFNLIGGSCDHKGAIIMDNSQQKEVKLGIRIAMPTDTRVLEGVSNSFKVQEGKTKKPAANKTGKKPSPPVPTQNLVQPTSTHATQHGQGHFLFSKRLSPDEQDGLPPPLIQGIMQKSEDNRLSCPPANVPLMVEGNGLALNDNSQQSSQQISTPKLWQPTNTHYMQHGQGSSLPPPSMPNQLQVAGYYPPLPACGQDQWASLPNASSEVVFPNLSEYGLLDGQWNPIPRGEMFVEDVNHSNVQPLVEEYYASFRGNQVLLQWDEPHVELKKHWNFLNQLMPLYSTQSGFYGETFPSTILMDKTHQLLASISLGNSGLKITSSVTSRATQTRQRRGVLIRPIEPYDSDDEQPVKNQMIAKYQLGFFNRVCSDYYTREQIKAKDGNLLRVALYDENNQVVTSGPLSSASVEVVLLHGDFNAEGRDYWTSEEFSACLVNSHYVKEPPALGGDHVFTLINGEAELGNAYFQTSSFHARTGKYMMGVQIKNVREGSVQEGITSPFLVRVRQGEESSCQRITSLEASLRVSKQVPPLECDTSKYDDILAVKVSTEEKFKRKNRKFKVKRKKDKNKSEEYLRILKEDHEELTSKTEDMRKEGCAEVNHYMMSPSQRSQVIQSNGFRLVIENSVSRTIYKNDTVKTEDGGDQIKVVMYDGGKPIASDHPLASVTVDLVVIEGGFDEKRDLWSEEEFEESIIGPRKGVKRLVKNGTFDLIDGRCDHKGAIIMDNSQRMEVKLGVRIAVHTNIRVIEGVSNPFRVQEGRTKINGKSTIPSKDDAVHQLKKISLKGKHCKNLMDTNITKVKHLLRHYHKDKFGLRKLVGMKHADWNDMINHATMCVPGDEIYSYWVQEDNYEILFNDFYDLVGKMTDDYVPYSVNDVDQFPPFKVNNWKKSAYKKFDERESSGVFGLTPDYFMNNGHPVRAVPLNNDACPFVQATTWQYPNDMAAQHGLNRSAVCQYTDARSPSSDNTNRNNVIPTRTTEDGNLGSLTTRTSSTSDMKQHQHQGRSSHVSIGVKCPQ